jgi:long-chain acyl-CoA synthetase
MGSVTSVEEFSSPALVDYPADGNLTDLVHGHAVRSPDVVLFRRRADGTWRDVTAGEFRDEVVSVAKGLVACGVGPGDRVGLMSRTRYEWTLLDFAIWFAGGVTVPVYETSSAEQVAWVLDDAGAVACVAETASHEAIVQSARDEAGSLKSIWQIDGGGVAALVAAGAAVDDAEIDRRRAGAGPGDIATVIYTSGTTGRPKGCPLTHGNFLFELGNVTAAVPELFGDDASTLLFLPLAHVFARIIEIGCVLTATPMGHSADIKNLVPTLAEFRPTFVLAVPRVFEKVYNSASQRAAAEGRGRIFDRAAAVAIAYSEGLDRGGAGLPVRLQHAAFDRLVYGKIRAALGGRARYAISGGAPLGARLGHFFRGIGLCVIEGYGLTETTAAATVNRVDDSRVGTVGRPIPGGAVRLADDGEILLRGGHVFRGYWENPAATAEVLDADSWFHTGDLGRLDDGYLTVTGRKKEIIVTAAGKNVAPAVLEDRLRAHALIAQCMVVGDAQPYIACLVTIDAEALPLWLEQHGRPKSLRASELTEDPQLRSEIQAAVDDANRAVSQAEAIKRFLILPDEWTESTGELTPSLKLKRAVVADRYAGAVEQLYS